MDREEILFRRLVRAFLEKHGEEVRKIVKGDILLEAGLKRLEEIAGITHHGSPGAEGALSSAAKAGAAHPLLPSPPPGRAREASNLSPSYPPGVPPAPTSFSEEG